MVIVKKAYKLTQFKKHISDTETVIMSDGDFDDIIDELGGFGKYQKRLLYILLSKYYYSTLPLAIVENEIRNNHMMKNFRSSVPDNALPYASSNVCSSFSGTFL